MSDQKYKATLSGDAGRSGWCVIFRHPVRKNPDGTAVRVRRGLGTKDKEQAQKMINGLNQILADPSYWSPTAKTKAEGLFHEKVVHAFYDNLLPSLLDGWSMRGEIIPLPGPEQGYARVRAVGTTGAGKTTLVRQFIGTDPKEERFPSTSTAKTTVCDLEIVIADGPFTGAVTFFPREYVRLHIEESVMAAAGAFVFGKGSPSTPAARLLEHSEQRFRLSYLLGNLKTVGDELSDDAEDSEEGVDQGGITDAERDAMSRRLESFLTRIETVAISTAQRLESDLSVSLTRADTKEENAFQELFELELRQQEDLHSVVDEILDAVEERFELLKPEGFTRDRSDWPLLWQFETTDRAEFIRTVNRFSSNYAPSFGRLLTPLVQGIRVRGPFTPSWAEKGECKLVLMDGEGLGHTPDSSSSISTNITQRLRDLDAIILVDNAEQPMQAAPQALLRMLAASGYERKLIVCFTHFDSVRGDNLRDISARKQHVYRSLQNAISSVRDSLGRSAENALIRVAEKRTFFVSKIQDVIEEKNRLTLSELARMSATMHEMIKPPPPTSVIPLYDRANLILCLPPAMAAFRDPWRGRLNLPSRSAVSAEHWTRIKALSRRFAELGTTEYDYLRPVADFIARLIEHVMVVISDPLKWEPEDAPEEMKRQVVNDITSEVHTELHSLAESRLFHDRIKEWATAYSRWGTGSARERARDIEAIYDLAAPIPGEMADLRASEFVSSILKVVQQAVERKGGLFE